MQLYLWQPRGLEPDAATRRFSSVLDRVAARYAQAYGRAYPVRVMSVAHCCLGLVGPAAGVAGAEPTLAPGPEGAVLAGVAEPDPDATSAFAPGIDGIDAWSASGAQPRGRWAAVAWRDGEAVALNAAAEGLRLWWTEGPDGWALGALMTPILALVGRARAVDLEVATLSAAFGYMASSRGILQGTHRFMPGNRVRLRAGVPPALEPSRSMSELLGPRRGLSYGEVVETMALRASRMAGAAVERCSNPTLGLSGGRDSRLLAAALSRAGRPIPASTGGPASHPDVVLARQVASTLGLEHRASADAIEGESQAARRERERSGGGSRALPMTADRLAAWVTLHDGTAPASLARVNPDLSVPRELSAEPTGQLFVGLGGEIHRGTYYPRARDLDQPGSAVRGPGYLLDLFASGVPLRIDVRNLFEAELEAHADAIGDMTLPLSEWMTRFFYRFRGATFRNADVMAQADGSRWVFAPLHDIGFVALSREAPATSKISHRLMEDVTAFLVPELKAVPYAPAPVSYRPEGVVRILARLGLLYSGPRREASSVTNAPTRCLGRRPAGGVGAGVLRAGRSPLA